MKILEGRHLTATDRKAIKFAIEGAHPVVYTKRKDYRLVKRDDGAHEICIAWFELNDWGKRVARSQHVVVMA